MHFPGLLLPGSVVVPGKKSGTLVQLVLMVSLLSIGCTWVREQNLVCVFGNESWNEYWEGGLPRWC